MASTLQPPRHLTKGLCLWAALPLLLALQACVGTGPAAPPLGTEPESAGGDAIQGRMLVLPGVYNTRFQLRGFVRRAQAGLPGFEIEVRRWGTPLLAWLNIRAYDRNVATATEMAREITAWRRQHPHEPFYLVGYSGGGGMAVLIAAELPSDVTIDRLILIAPAISPGYPLEREVLPKVGEFVANFASERDRQVGWGTRTFGTIDRAHVTSAGAAGFAASDPKLIEWHWREADRDTGHRGSHVSYLGRRWQEEVLLPAFDPDIDAAALSSAWAARHEEP